MPKLFELLGYSVYFWSNEDGEPVHVHVSKGKATVNSTKFWVLSDGGIIMENNSSKISNKELRKITKILELRSNDICQMWLDKFGSIKYYI